MGEITTDNKKITLTWAKTIPVVASLLFISNTFTLQMVEIANNKDNNIKTEKAGARRLEHAIEKQDFKNQIKDLTRELKKCNEK
tara:strand:+ start:9769 stop:10020 length:252 start_codon:yes stop_codon:yes gene_type:complete